MGCRDLGFEKSEKGLTLLQIRTITPPIPCPPEGRFAIRHDTWGAGLRWTRLPSSAKKAARVRSSRVVLTPRRLASSSWEASRFHTGDGDNESAPPGRARSKP